MRGVWVDAGNDPNYDKINAAGIRWLYFPLSDPVADVRRRLLDAKQRGYQAGVYNAWNWYGNPSGEEYARITSSAITALKLPVTNSFPKVMLDDERHEPATIIQLLQAWRRMRRNQDTAWTLEGNQGGWFTPELVSAIVAAKVRVVPQCYRGDMVPVDALAMVRDITKRGVPDSIVSPFYDAAALQLDWQGFAFTMGRLP